MLTVIALILGWWAFAPELAGQVLPEVLPAKIGLTESGVRRLDSLLDANTAPGRYPALMLMVTWNGKVGYWKAAGARDLATGERLDRNDLFRVYSITKPVTAVAILQLWEEGKLGLDDPVERYLPALGRVGVFVAPGKTRPPRRPLTIRHLLTFSAGMTYGTLGERTVVDSILAAAPLYNLATSSADLVERLSALPLLGDPGDSVSYGYQTDVLGRVVEVVSGMTLDRYFQERIFGPLGMRETGFFMSPALLNRYPNLYALGPGQVPQVADRRDSTSDWILPFGRRSWINFPSGGAGLVSTPADYIRFVQMLANRGELGGVRLLRPGTVDTMAYGHAKGNARTSGIFGPGWDHGFAVVRAADIAAAGGGGSNRLFWMAGAANLYWWVDPASGIAAMIWAQALPPNGALFNEFRRGVAAAVEASAR